MSGDAIEAIIRRFADSSGAAIDVGAHRGAYTRVLSDCFRQVTAFEPDPRIYPILRQNVAAANVVTEACAVSDHVGEVRLYLDRREEFLGVASSVNRLVDLAGLTVEAVVSCTTLDTYCAQHSLVPQLIKISVTGHEPQVIAGARQTIAQARPVLIMEFWESWYRNGFREMFLGLEADYELYVVGTDESVRERYLDSDGVLDRPSTVVAVYGMPRRVARRAAATHSDVMSVDAAAMPPPADVTRLIEPTRQYPPSARQLEMLINSGRAADGVELLDGIDLTADQPPDFQYMAAVCLGAGDAAPLAIDLLKRAAAGGYPRFWCAYHLGLFEERRGNNLDAACYYTASLLANPAREDIWELLQRMAPNADVDLLRQAQAGGHSPEAAARAVRRGIDMQAAGDATGAACCFTVALALDRDSDEARSRLLALAPDISLDALVDTDMDRLAARLRERLIAPANDEFDLDRKIAWAETVYKIYSNNDHPSGRTLVPELAQIFRQALTARKLDVDAFCIFFEMLYFLYCWFVPDWSDMSGIAEEVMRPAAAAIRAGAVRGLLAIEPRPLGLGPRRLGYLANAVVPRNPVGRGVGDMLVLLSRHLPGVYQIVLYAWQHYDDAFLSTLEAAGITVRRFTGSSASERVEAVATSVTTDEIDILISDLNGGLPSLLFERRVAPVQIFFQTGLPYWPLENLDGVFRIEFYDPRLDGFEREFCFDLGLGPWRQEGYAYDPPVDPSQVAAERARLGIPADAKLAGIYGRLVKIKPSYMEMVIELIERHSRLVVLLGGTGQVPWLHRFIAEHGLAGQVVLVNDYVDGHLWGHMLDVFLDTSVDVTVAGREVMAKGKPIVCMRTQTLEHERLPTLIADSPTVYVDLVSRLIDDPEFYREACDATRDFVAAQPDERAYAAAVHEALEAVLARVRRGAPTTSAGRVVGCDQLAVGSVLETLKEETPTSVEVTGFADGTRVLTARVNDLVYVPQRHLQVWRDRIIPLEANTDDDAVAVFFRLSRERAESSQVLLVNNVIDDEVCILSNLHSHNFYHFLEELYKVVILEQQGFTGQYVISPHPTWISPEFPRFATDLLTLLRIPSERIMTLASPAVFRRAWLTSHITHNDVTQYPAVFFTLRNALMAAVNEPGLGSRLWLDRKGVRVVANRDEVQDCLHRHGFTIVEMSELPVARQIAAVAAADIIAGPHGAAFALSMFMKERSTVIECFSPDNVNGCIFDICTLLQHQYFNLTSPGAASIEAANTPSRRYKHGGDVFVDTNHLDLLLQAIDLHRQPLAQRRTRATPMAPLKIAPADCDLAVVSAADDKFFDLLQGMVRSLRDQPDGRAARLYIIDIGMTDEQRRWLQEQGATLHVPDDELFWNGMPGYLRAFLSRCRIPEQFPGQQVYLWIDADAWIQRWDAVEAYVKGALRAGFAITPETDPAYDRADVLSSHEASYAAFGPEWIADLHATGPFNAGVFAGRADAPHWRAWRQMIEREIGKTDDPGQLFLLDQTALSLVCKQYAAETAVLPATCNWVACFALPAVSDDGEVLLRPAPPYEPLGIVHQADYTKRRSFELPRRSGGTVRRTLGHTGSGRLAESPDCGLPKPGPSP